VALSAASLIAMVRAYPDYFPYVSPAGMGRPLYWLMSDSNVDWNQALPEVDRFARQHGLTDVPLDNYGFSNAATYVRHARLWDCQDPRDSEAGHWVVLSADMILDGHNCGWLLRYPQVTLAAGGMIAFRLPSPIPPAGSAGGPPLPADRHLFLHAPVDMRTMFRDIDDHPARIEPTVDAMMASWRKAMAEAKRKQKGN